MKQEKMKIFSAKRTSPHRPAVDAATPVAAIIAFSSRTSFFSNFTNSELLIAISFGLHKTSFKSPVSIKTAPAAGSISDGIDCCVGGSRGVVC
jgi:hypothetical protein